jgi:hypothetical protein
MPPKLTNYKGEERRVGFELEYSGLALPDVAHIIQTQFGGAVACINEFAYKVRGTEWGDFSVESDSSYLKDKKFEKILEALPVDGATKQNFTEKLSDQSDLIIPHEIVTPPIPLSQLDCVEELRAIIYTETRQRERSTSSLAPCGLHINPELSASDPRSILNILRAFTMLYDLLVERRKVAVSRRIWPYIAPYPQEYKDLILQPSYDPDMPQLIGHYIRYNPTRNRALDMLPIFAWLDEERVFAHSELELSLIKKRPAFHYRLPNCLLDDPDWRVADEWMSWVQIERLAAEQDQQALDKTGKVREQSSAESSREGIA